MKQAIIITHIQLFLVVLFVILIKLRCCFQDYASSFAICSGWPVVDTGYEYNIKSKTVQWLDVQNFYFMAHMPYKCGEKRQGRYLEGQGLQFCELITGISDGDRKFYRDSHLDIMGVPS